MARTRGRTSFRWTPLSAQSLARFGLDSAVAVDLFRGQNAADGYRLNTDITFRGSFQSRKAYTRPAWDQQAGVSVVWAHRWW